MWRSKQLAVLLLSLAPTVVPALAQGQGPSHVEASEVRETEANRSIEAAEVGAAKSAASESVRAGLYLPPPRSTPQGVRLVGAGTRQGAGDIPRILPLAPDHVGLTEQAQPTFHWTTAGGGRFRRDFLLVRVESGDVVLEVTLPDETSEGSHALDLAAHGVRLEPDTTYRWHVVIVPDPANRDQDVISAANVRRVRPPQGAEAGTTDWATLARRSIWYDALTRVSRAADLDPSRAADRRRLLATVGLATAID